MKRMLYTNLIVDRQNQLNTKMMEIGSGDSELNETYDGLTNQSVGLIIEDTRASSASNLKLRLEKEVGNAWAAD